MLPLEAGRAAVRLARAHAEARVLGGPPAEGPGHEALAQPRGAFVSLWGPALRGCVGYPEPLGSLRATLAEAARGAVRDPRFPAVEAGELPGLRVEVSVLTPPRPLRAARPEDLPGMVRVGEHGLVLAAGARRALLLPQVALEHGLDAQGLLEACCAKAGLRPDAWRARPDLAWSVFGAQVFHERAPRGDVDARGEPARPDVA